METGSITMRDVLVEVYQAGNLDVLLSHRGTLTVFLAYLYTAVPVPVLWRCEAGAGSLFTVSHSAVRNVVTISWYPSFFCYWCGRHCS